MTDEYNVTLGFSGVGNRMLPPWEIRPGIRYKYQLPDIKDKDLIELSLRYNLVYSILSECDCYEYNEKSH